jgi:hypothetical protein
MQRAFIDPKCVAFNTFGYLKSNLVNLTKPSCFRESDGLFVKRSFLEQVADNKVTVQGLLPSRALELLNEFPLIHSDAEQETQCESAPRHHDESAPRHHDESAPRHHDESAPRHHDESAPRQHDDTVSMQREETESPSLDIFDNYVSSVILGSS